MTTAIVPTVTGWQGTWSNILNHDNGDSTNAYGMIAASQNGARNPQDGLIARSFKRNGYRGINALMIQLIGAATGGTASATHRQVGAPAGGPQTAIPGVTGVGDFGGNRVIETVTDINRTTTAADVTWLEKFFDNKLLEAGITYPIVSGSGGGGKLTNGGVRF
jgi:hypothetical protein